MKANTKKEGIYLSAPYYILYCPQSGQADKIKTFTIHIPENTA